MPKAVNANKAAILYLSVKKKAMARRIIWQARPFLKPFTPKVKNIREENTKSIPKKGFEGIKFLTAHNTVRIYPAYIKVKNS